MVLLYIYMYFFRFYLNFLFLFKVGSLWHFDKEPCHYRLSLVLNAPRHQCRLGCIRDKTRVDETRVFPNNNKDQIHQSIHLKGSLRLSEFPTGRHLLMPSSDKMGGRYVLLNFPPRSKSQLFYVSMLFVFSVLRRPWCHVVLLGCMRTDA
jgi:hypothetical protein